MFINLKIGGGIKERSESTIRYFNDIKSFYKTKCKELGIKKNDMENDEKY